MRSKSERTVEGFGKRCTVSFADKNAWAIYRVALDGTHAT
jgi:hypothetical protein